MQNEDQRYAKYTTKARLDKAVNTLLGIIAGISMDGVINTDEVKHLAKWLTEHEEHHSQHPFTELIPIILRALEDGVIDEEERKDILWTCENIKSTEFYDEITADLQRLQAIMGGIAADQIINEKEIVELQAWIEENAHLRTRYPFDEIDSLLISIMQDGIIDEREHEVLLEFLKDFSSLGLSESLNEKAHTTITGVCAIDPDIEFEEKTFCITGGFADYKRAEIREMIESRGGRLVKAISRKVDYLLIGSDGNKHWKYACYGRKVEEAIKLRKNGGAVILIHEYDFLDATL